jgi:hypothetical protein
VERERRLIEGGLKFYVVGFSVDEHNQDNNIASKDATSRKPPFTHTAEGYIFYTIYAIECQRWWEEIHPYGMEWKTGVALAIALPFGFNTII